MLRLTFAAVLAALLAVAAPGPGAAAGGPAPQISSTVVRIRQATIAARPASDVVTPFAPPKPVALPVRVYFSSAARSHALFRRPPPTAIG